MARSISPCCVVVSVESASIKEERRGPILHDVKHDRSECQGLATPVERRVNVRLMDITVPIIVVVLIGRNLRLTRYIGIDRNTSFVECSISGLDYSAGTRKIDLMCLGVIGITNEPTLERSIL
jgi:hypothetical protein